VDRFWAMQVFVRVVEAGSFSRAANQLDMANASVTSCVQNLEKHLRVTLLQRSTRHLHLTEEGEAFYERCRSILAEVEEAEASVVTAKEGLRGTLKIEMPIAVGHSLLSPAFAEFCKRYNGIRIIATLTNEVETLVGRGIDVAIRMEETNEVDNVARRIYQSKYIVCGSPEFFRQHKVPRTAHDINPAWCLGLSAPPTGRFFEWKFSKGADSLAIHPEGRLAFNSSDALIQAASRSAGLIYVLDVLARSALESGRLIQILADWETAARSFYVVYPKSKFVSPKVRALIDFLLETFSPGLIKV
jgi:LysR family transcriptional regulator for bpeEF and oprC